MATKLVPILGLPTYDGSSLNRSAVVSYARAFPEGAIVEPSSSCLGQAFNLAYQYARKEADAGNATHFIMLHADVIPLNHDWGQILLDECERTQASILSVILPIKTGEGLTSTAIEAEETVAKGQWHPVRFTMKEVFNMPETFTHPRLLLNTGLMVIDLRKEWSRELVFDIQCGVKFDRYEPYFLPEDWLMSRFATGRGEQIYATRKVRALHMGKAPYGNDKSWGSKATEGAWDLFYK